MAILIGAMFTRGFFLSEVPYLIPISGLCVFQFHKKKNDRCTYIDIVRYYFRPYVNVRSGNKKCYTVHH